MWISLAVHLGVKSLNRPVFTLATTGNSNKHNGITLAQLRTGHSQLLASFLHRISWQSSAMCPHCNIAEETRKHLLLRCPSHARIRQETWPDLHISSDPRRLWSYMERIGAVTRHPDWEWERESITAWQHAQLARTAVTFSDAQHQWPLVGHKLYCQMTEKNTTEWLATTTAQLSYEAE